MNTLKLLGVLLLLVALVMAHVPKTSTVGRVLFDVSVFVSLAFLLLA